MNGYFDLQVNGYAGVDFNTDDLSAEGLHKACELLHEHGVGGILATIITEHVPTMCHRLRKLEALRAADPLAQQMIPGYHVEGPFLNETPGYRGAHPVDAIIPADVELAKQLVDAGGGRVKLVTLAPERDRGAAVTSFLAQQGIAVSAGHCDASLDELRGALDAGLTLFTHLGNGCPPNLPRHDNIVQRAMSLSDRLTCCFIADGVHVPTFALRNYLKCCDISRCVVVTDAMSAAGLGPGLYRLGRWEVLVGDDFAARAPDRSHLVGSAMTMPQNLTNLQALGLNADECDALLRRNPLKAVGL